MSRGPTRRNQRVRSKRRKAERAAKKRAARAQAAAIMAAQAKREPVTVADVRRLFRAPFEVGPMRLYIFDANGRTAASVVPGHDAAPIPRGWGRIQYLNRGGELMGEWVAEYDRVVGDEANIGEVCHLLNVAWAEGGER